MLQSTYFTGNALVFSVSMLKFVLLHVYGNGNLFIIPCWKGIQTKGNVIKEPKYYKCTRSNWIRTDEICFFCLLPVFKSNYLLFSIWEHFWLKTALKYQQKSVDPVLEDKVLVFFIVYVCCRWFIFVYILFCFVFP